MTPWSPDRIAELTALIECKAEHRKMLAARRGA